MWLEEAMKVLCYNHTRMNSRVKDLEVGHQSVGWTKSGMMLSYHYKL